MLWDDSMKPGPPNKAGSCGAWAPKTLKPKSVGKAEQTYPSRTNVHYVCVFICICIYILYIYISFNEYVDKGSKSTNKLQTCRYSEVHPMSDGKIEAAWMAHGFARHCTCCPSNWAVSVAFHQHYSLNARYFQICADMPNCSKFHTGDQTSPLLTLLASCTFYRLVSIHICIYI